MRDERKKKRRQAMMLNEHILIIDVDPKQMELIRKGKLALEKVKYTSKLTVLLSVIYVKITPP